MCKSFTIWLIVAVLQISFAEAVAAQANTQQMHVSSTGSAANRTGSRAAAPTGSSGLTLIPEDVGKLRLAPGFLLSVNVLDDSDFVGNYRVDQQGDISLPILGTIHVAGETAPEARDQIVKRLLDDKLLKEPQVNLMVVEYTAPEVTIIGEVASPGKYPLLVEHKLVDVLALAGGTTMLAGDEVQITRGNGEEGSLLVHYSKATNPKKVEDAIVQPGDTVQVKRAGIVYVLGAVNRPGGYVMQEEGTLTLLQAISLAMGLGITATDKVYLIHTNANGSKVMISLPYKKISHGHSADVELHATDVLYVPTSKVKTFLIDSQGIITSTASAAVYKY